MRTGVWVPNVEDGAGRRTASTESLFRALDRAWCVYWHEAGDDWRKLFRTEASARELAVELSRRGVSGAAVRRVPERVIGASL